ncbi:MAG TPA: gamma-glutamyltransferase [Candidatus Dormibacteraeota bacterium]|nr:gamma-glutamyltransferase [Candidatus Dormibacteraeota bacterium]
MIRLRALAPMLIVAAMTSLPAGGWHGARPVVARHAMVVTEQRLASDVGLQVLREGGNAVDAAVAVGYALAVVDPCCGNIGGGGFMIVRMHDGRERFIDFREVAPSRATRTMYLDAHGNVEPAKSRKGWLAVGVPGSVLGLETARREYGTMSRAALMAPAIAFARDGFRLGAGDLIPFRAMPGGYAAARWAMQTPPRVGELFRQPQLAATLALIARDGPRAFYRGPIARAVVAAANAGGGVLTMEDFARYRVVQASPLHCSYHGYLLSAAPPPSSAGVTLCEILGILAPYPLSQWPWHGLRETHYVVEADRRAYADRNAALGDPAFVRNPVAQLLAPAYLARLRASIDPSRATPSSDVHPGLAALAHEHAQTTHYSIVDARGNAVAVTYTLNDWFGAGVVAGNTGFFLNDEMDDFTSKPGAPNMYGLVQGKANAIAPGKRPLSSMAPTIVTRNGRLVMVTGSPGGSRIITIVLETLLDVFEHRMNVAQAVDAPRIHMQWLPDEIQYEPGALTGATLRGLRTEGYALREIATWGSAQAIVVDSRTRLLEGASDRRRPPGGAAGY